MTDIDQLVDWRIDYKTPVMTKQFAFDSYEQTRTFVNDLADLSEETGYYPNLTYSQTQATVTIFTDDKEFSEEDIKFAHRTDSLLTQHTS